MPSILAEICDRLFLPRDRTGNIQLRVLLQSSEQVALLIALFLAPQRILRLPVQGRRGLGLGLRLSLTRTLVLLRCPAAEPDPAAGFP